MASSRPQITKELSEATKNLICPSNDPRIYWAREVTFDYSTSRSKRVDFISKVPKGY